jgi:hypothetical protein
MNSKRADEITETAEITEDVDEEQEIQDEVCTLEWTGQSVETHFQL